MNGRFALGAFVFTSLAAAFVPPANGARPLDTPATMSPSATLPPVDELPAPKLPSWIASIDPAGGEIDADRQIRVTFTDDLVPLTTLESPSRLNVLSHFKLEPAMPGRFLILTPRMVVFQGDAELPPATRFRMTISRGLQDRKGHALGTDIAWTFRTGQPFWQNALPDDDEDVFHRPFPLEPSIHLTAKIEEFMAPVPLDIESLRAHVVLRSRDGKGAPVDVSVEPDAASPAEAVVTPQSPLRPDTAYELDITPGVALLGGNLPVAGSYRGTFKTYSPPVATATTYGGYPNWDEAARFAGGAPSLKFSNPIVVSSALERIHVSVPVAAGRQAFVFDSSRTEAQFDPSLFKPDSTARITIDKGLLDDFGQTFQRNQTFTVPLGDFWGKLWSVNGMVNVPAGYDDRIPVEAVNLIDDAYWSDVAVLRPQDVTVDGGPQPSGYVEAFDPKKKWPRYELRHAPNVPQHPMLFTRDPLTTSSARAVRYGIFADENLNGHEQDGRPRYGSSRFDGVIQRTNIGLIVQFFENVGVVDAYRIDTGSAIEDASIDLYRSLPWGTDPASATPCASGKTDSSGRVEFSGKAMAACSLAVAPGRPRPVTVLIARSGDDWAFIRSATAEGWFNGAWDPYEPDYDPGSGFEGRRATLNGSVFLDRALYQPGEHVRAAVVAGDRWLGQVTAHEGAFHGTMQTPRGKMVDLGAVALGPEGVGSVDVPLSKSAETGYYSLKFTAADGQSLNAQFQIQEIRLPLFSMSLRLDRTVLTSGTPLVATATGRYLFSAPVPSARVRFSLQRNGSTYFVPPGWELRPFTFSEFNPGRSGYSAYNPWSSRDKPEVLATLESGRTGEAAYRFNAPLESSSTGYSLEAEMRDTTNAAVADRKDFVVLPSDVVLGFSTLQLPVHPGEPFTMSVVALDGSGHFVPGTSIHVVLQRFTTDPDLKPDDDAAAARQWHDVSALDIRSASAPSDVTFTAPTEARYRLLATARDAAGRLATAVEELEAHPAVPPQPAGAFLGLRLAEDREYHAGERVTVTLAPYAGSSRISIGIVSHGVLSGVQNGTIDGPRKYSFEITRAMAPGATIVARCVLTGRLNDGDIGHRAATFEQGLNISLDANRLRVTVGPSERVTEPSGHETLRIHVSDESGAGLSAKVVLAVVDFAALQILPRPIPDLAATMYGNGGWQTGSINTIESLRLTVPSPPAYYPEDRFRIPLGGYSVEGEARTIGEVKLKANAQSDSAYVPGQTLNSIQIAGPRILQTTDKVAGWPASQLPSAIAFRKSFSSLAYFSAAIRADSNGNAVVRIPLPDNLTTWDVVALAVTSDERFGSGTASFKTVKPVLVNPAVPAFLRPGDRALAGAIVTNESNRRGPLRFFAESGKGVNLEGGRSKEQFDVPFGPGKDQTTTYRLAIFGEAVSSSSIKLGAAMTAFSDGFELPLPVRESDSMEFVAVTGRTKDVASIPLELERSVPSEHGGLDISMSSTLLPEVLQPFSKTIDDDFPTAYSLAARIRVLSDVLILQRIYRRPIDALEVRRRLEAALDERVHFARDDGGYADLPDERFQSDWPATIELLEALSRARLAGLIGQVDVAESQRYLTQKLRDYGRGCSPAPWCRQRFPDYPPILQSVEAINDSGGDLPAGLGDVCEGIAATETDRLTRALGYARFPDCRQQALTLRASIQSEMRETSRSTVGGGWVPGSYEAGVLQLYLMTGADEERNDRLLIGLLSAERDGSWGWSGANADALDAVADYARHDTVLPDFDATARVGERAIAAKFFGYRKTQASGTIPLSSVPRPKANVELSKVGDGTLHYAVVLRYSVYGASSGQYAGLRVDRFVRRANEEPLFGSYGLEAPSGPLSLDEGAVYDVEDRLISDHPIDRVLLTDPLPAGVEPIDESLATSSMVERAGGNDVPWWYRRWWCRPTYVDMHKDRVLSYFDRLGAGTYSVHYLVRVTVPGTFLWPGATAQLERVPEDFGRSAAGIVQIDSTDGAHILTGGK